MTIDPARLLKRLEPVVRPVSATGAVVNGRLPLESQGFDELLQLVSHGEMSSGAPVQVSDSITLALEEDQLDRLAAAADVAQAAGARRALALLDGRGLVLDVADRSVSEELTGDSSSASEAPDAVARERCGGCRIKNARGINTMLSKDPTMMSAAA